MTSRELWRSVSGILCVYKRSEMSTSALKKIVTNCIVSSNEYCRPERLRLIRIPRVESHETGAPVTVGYNEVVDYRYSPLVSGDFVRGEDVQLLDLCPLKPGTSGVCLLGVNEGCSQLPALLERSWVNFYKVEGVLDKDENMHISKHKLEKLLTRMESEFRKAVFQYANVDLQSEEAFQMASKGLPRVKLPGAQVIYAVSLGHYSGNHFSVNVQASGENEELLQTLIHNVGASLGIKATCTKIIRRAVGPFTGEDALLEKQLTVQNVIRNISYVRRILELSNEDTKLANVKDSEKELSEREARKVIDGLGLKEDRIDDYDGMRPMWPRSY